jgi:hypothetical protein
MKRAGQSETDDEDEYGNPITLEDMTDSQLIKWRGIVKSLIEKTPLAEFMLEQVDEEIHRRKMKEHRLVVGEI